MKRIALALPLAVACYLAAAASLSAHPATTSGPPCTPKKGTLNGKPVFYLCGPATATVKVGAKTYSFRNGYCEMKKGTTSLSLFLGTLVETTTKGNAGKPILDLTAEHFGGTEISAGGTVSASYGGKQVVNNLTTNTGHFPNQGTFKTISSPKITGTWNCHNVIYHSP